MNFENITDIGLAFNPFKLCILLIWAYGCLYSIRLLEQNELVPEKARKIMNTLSLFAGPLILFMFFSIKFFNLLAKGDLASLFAKNTEIPINLIDSTGKTMMEMTDNPSRNKETTNLTKKIVYDALKKKASDILIDPKNNGVYTIRYRIDGILRTVLELEESRCVPVISVIKALSNMDIAEKRRPQDGAFSVEMKGGNASFRVASAGVYGGEKLSIRVLNQNAGLIKLSDLGMSENNHKAVFSAVKQPSGMVLVCGPTGSGKTTTLYAMLTSIDAKKRNVITVEDPIEYVLPEASQIEVNVKAGITFANTLRGMLRQDPDVICVGEIRDGETAEIAIQAAQTGHLVLATLHSSSNLGAIVRLMDLGANPRAIASAVSVIVSQRLVRKLCENCKEPMALTNEQMEHYKGLGLDPTEFFSARGCKNCDGTGYSGRIGILDILVMTEKLKNSLESKEKSQEEMIKQGDEMGRSTLWKEGIEKVYQGLTTIEEVERVVANL